MCVDLSLTLEPNRERLVLDFEEELDAYEVRRTGNTRVSVIIPGAREDLQAIAVPLSLAQANILAGIRPHAEGLVIDTKSPSFGFLSLTLDNGRRIAIDLFTDPLGARWEPSGRASPAKPATPPARTAQAAPPTRPAKPEPSAKPAATPEPDTDTGQSGRTLDEREARAKVQVVRRAVEQAPSPSPEPGRESAAWTPSGGARGVYRGVVDPTRMAAGPDAEAQAPSPLPLSAERRPRGPWEYRGVVPSDEAAERPAARRFAPEELPEPAPERPGLITDALGLAESEPEPPPPPVEGEEQVAEAGQEIQPDLEQKLLGAQVLVSTGEYDKALREVESLLAMPNAPKELREEAMYTRADILYQVHRDNLKDNFDLINGAYEAAMNYNLDSERVPSALLRRGILNMRVGNIPEAKAFFQVIRKNYPNDANVPLTYYYWGDYYYNQGDYQEAADQFQYLVQVYPESKFIREASVSLARSLRKLGYDEQAFQIVDFIEKRWPRFYVEYPPFMKLSGDAAYFVKDWEKAKDEYWTYFNIDPRGDDADEVLARLGDIYIRTDRPNAAREIYEKAVAEFPDKEGGLIAQMRLAEEGIYDEPSLEDMFKVFERPFNLKPEQIYAKIVEEHPESELAPLAQLKMGMWHLWNKKYLDALSAVTGFNEKFPDSALKQRSDEVGLQAFGGVVDQLIAEENYPKIVNLYEDYDFVKDSWPNLRPDTKLAVGLSFWKRGDPDQALRIISPLLMGGQVPEYSEMALSLALSIYVDNRRWEDVKKLNEIAQEWELPPDYQREMRYALALAHENLGETDKSREMWLSLGNNMDLDPEQRAYAIYFLAQRSLEDEDLKGAYEYAQESLDLLLLSGKDEGKIMDNLRILIDVAETSGRPREALDWANRYEKYLEPGETGWDALRYRMAGLHKKAGDVKTWREILGDLAKRSPNTLYGRMAASDLETFSLEQAAGEFAPAPTLQ